MNVKYFYLNINMDRVEYINIQTSMIPQAFADKYNLKGKAHNGYIFAWVTKGLYELPQAGRISYDALVQHLELYV